MKLFYTFISRALLVIFTTNCLFPSVTYAQRTRRKVDIPADGQLMAQRESLRVDSADVVRMSGQRTQAYAQMYDKIAQAIRPELETLLDAYNQAKTAEEIEQAVKALRQKANELVEQAQMSGVFKTSETALLFSDENLPDQLRIPFEAGRDSLIGNLDKYNSVSMLLEIADPIAYPPTNYKNRTEAVQIIANTAEHLLSAKSKLSKEEIGILLRVVIRLFPQTYRTAYEKKITDEAEIGKAALKGWSRVALLKIYQLFKQNNVKVADKYLYDTKIDSWDSHFIAEMDALRSTKFKVDSVASGVYAAVATGAVKFRLAKDGDIVWLMRRIEPEKQNKFNTPYDVAIASVLNEVSEEIIKGTNTEDKKKKLTAMLVDFTDTTENSLPAQVFALQALANIKAQGKANFDGDTLAQLSCETADLYVPLNVKNYKSYGLNATQMLGLSEQLKTIYYAFMGWKEPPASVFLSEQEKAQLKGVTYNTYTYNGKTRSMAEPDWNTYNVEDVDDVVEAFNNPVALADNQAFRVKQCNGKEGIMYVRSRENIHKAGADFNKKALLVMVDFYLGSVIIEAVAPYFIYYAKYVYVAVKGKATAVFARTGGKVAQVAGKGKNVSKGAVALSSKGGEALEEGSNVARSASRAKVLEKVEPLPNNVMDLKVTSKTGEEAASVISPANLKSSVEGPLETLVSEAKIPGTTLGDRFKNAWGWMEDWSKSGRLAAARSGQLNAQVIPLPDLSKARMDIFKDLRAQRLSPQQLTQRIAEAQEKAATLRAGANKAAVQAQYQASMSYRGANKSTYLSKVKEDTLAKIEQEAKEWDNLGQTYREALQAEEKAAKAAAEQQAAARSAEQVAATQADEAARAEEGLKDLARDYYLEQTRIVEQARLGTDTRDAQLAYERIARDARAKGQKRLAIMAEQRAEQTGQNILAKVSERAQSAKQAGLKPLGEMKPNEAWQTIVPDTREGLPSLHNGMSTFTEEVRVHKGITRRITDIQNDLRASGQRLAKAVNDMPTKKGYEITIETYQKRMQDVIQDVNAFSSDSALSADLREIQTLMDRVSSREVQLSEKQALYAQISQKYDAVFAKQKSYRDALRSHRAWANRAVNEVDPSVLREVEANLDHVEALLLEDTQKLENMAQQHLSVVQQHITGIEKKAARKVAKAENTARKAAQKEASRQANAARKRSLREFDAERDMRAFDEDPWERVAREEIESAWDNGIYHP